MRTANILPAVYLTEDKLIIPADTLKYIGAEATEYKIEAKLEDDIIMSKTFVKSGSYGTGTEGSGSDGSSTEGSSSGGHSSGGHSSGISNSTESSVEESNSETINPVETNFIANIGWNRNTTGWWYCYDGNQWHANCWQYINNEWYYFNEQGYAIESQWLFSNNEWYYLDKNCKMLHNCWRKINGKWYYFGEKGNMYSNRYTPDGYWVDETGAWN